MTNNVALLLVKNKLEAVQLTINARGREKTGRKSIHSFERGTATAHPSSFLYNLHSVIQRPGFDALSINEGQLFHVNDYLRH